MIIAITGGPRSAKSTIGDMVANMVELPHFITDDWKHLGYEPAKDAIVGWLKRNNTTNFVLSGMNTARVMRELARQGVTFADLVIKIECDLETISHFYRKAGEADKIPYIESVLKANETVTNDWLRVAKQKGHEPEIIEVDTSLAVHKRKRKKR